MIVGSSNGSHLRLVPAGPDDARRLFELRNDPFIVALSASRRAVPWQEHIAWFGACLAAPDRHRILFVMERESAAGVVRFERKVASEATVSIYLLEAATGRGLGSESLRSSRGWIFREWDIDAIVAEVSPANARSARSFAKVGFAEDETVGPRAGLRRLVLRRPRAEPAS